MKRALVTGGSGFLGSHIADTLSARGWAVTLFDRRPSPWRRPDQEMVVGDVLDQAAVGRAVEGAAAVYHLAALADLEAARARPLEAARTNVLGTVGLLEAARAAGVERFLFASTVYVYSRAGGFYRCSKQACEAFIEEYRRQFGLPYTILRYGSLYGPRADESNGFYRLLKQAATEGRVRHEGSPDDVREYIHVEDAARLSADALDPAHADQHLILTGHHPTPIRDLFILFSEILGREIEVEVVPPREGADDAHYRITPYAYSPRVGRKLTSNLTVDMGQGVLQLLAQIDRERAAGEAAPAAKRPEARPR